MSSSSGTGLLLAVNLNVNYLHSICNGKLVINREWPKLIVRIDQEQWYSPFTILLFIEVLLKFNIFGDFNY